MLGNSDRGESNFVGKRTKRATQKRAKILKPSKGDFANKWKSETFRPDGPTKSPKPKTQEKMHTKSVFGELGLVMTSTTSTKTTPR